MLCHTICLDMGKNSSFGLVLTKIVKEINGYGELQGKEIGIYMSRIPESRTRSCQDISAAPEANHMNNSSIRDKPLNILGRYWAGMMCCRVSYNSSP